MKKLIDFDGIFDEKLADYMEKNMGKYSEKQWESIIPQLYKKFGDTHLSVAKNTPKGYYAAMTDEELVETLVRHIREEVPVSDFLCRELEGRGCPDALVNLLGEKEVELLTLAVNLVGANPKGYAGYFNILEDENAEENVVEAICDQLKMGADAAKEMALDCYGRGVRSELMLEILSRCHERDDAVFEILLAAFKESEEEMTMRASYLAAYGDARALEPLLEVIDREDINFLEYQELKYAIEALGGEYTRPRDFSNDPYFLELVAQQSEAVDILQPKKTEA